MTNLVTSFQLDKLDGKTRMQKTSAFLWCPSLLSGILSLLAHPTFAAGTAQDVFKQRASHVVIVRAIDGFGRIISQGSGVVLGPSACSYTGAEFPSFDAEADRNGQDILSNFHVVCFASRLMIETREGKKMRAAIVWADADSDLVVLRSEQSWRASELPLTDVIEEGQAVFAIGAPKGLGWTISSGIVSGKRNGNSNTLIQTTAPISAGSSGGGLFSDGGALVGITTSQVKEGQNLNFALWLSVSQREIIKRHRRGASLRLGPHRDDRIEQMWAVGYWESFHGGTNAWKWQDEHSGWQVFRASGRLLSSLDRYDIGVVKVALDAGVHGALWMAFPRYLTGFSSAVQTDVRSDMKENFQLSLLKKLPDEALLSSSVVIHAAGVLADTRNKAKATALLMEFAESLPVASEALPDEKRGVTAWWAAYRRSVIQILGTTQGKTFEQTLREKQLLLANPFE